MKQVLLTLTVCLVGCLKPIPPAPEPPHVIVVAEIPAPVAPLVIEDEPDAGPPVHTWLTGEELQKVLDERAKLEDSGCVCLQGDPLCDCL